ncbi:MAG: hypothetical protein MUC69_02350 [Gemmatimonadales bacterium]|jgi:hypothetical protein|nr:hypothetical protein [Gemmatimonadales bacterium]
MTDVADWLEAHTRDAPPLLRRRVLEHAAPGTAGDVPGRLAEAAVRALTAVERHAGDRSAALDLLAADALVTLALLAQAELAPAGLLGFARRTLHDATAA